MRAISLAAFVCCLAAGPVAAIAQQSQEPTVYKPGSGVSAPTVIKEVKPQYTADAMRARVEGTVTLEGCRAARWDHRRGPRHEGRSIPGLDQEAIKAAKRWRFEPGTKDGKPVPVRVTLEMSFTLRDRPAKPPIQFGSASSVGAGGASQPETTRVFKPGDGVSAPVAVKQVKPQYTAAAREAGSRASCNSSASSKPPAVLVTST